MSDRIRIAYIRDHPLDFLEGASEDDLAALLDGVEALRVLKDAADVVRVYPEPFADAEEQASAALARFDFGDGDAGVSRARDLAQAVVAAIYEKASLEQAEAAEGYLFEIVRLAADAERYREALEQIASQPHVTKARKMEIARSALEVSA